MLDLAVPTLLFLGVLAHATPAAPQDPAPREALALTEGPYETLRFSAADGGMVFADAYIKHADPQTPFVLLFHQARSSRGEYREIGPRLNALGFNCMAVDLRSGRAHGGIKNETARHSSGKSGYLDTLPDLEAALEYAREHFARGKLVCLGSSYSASLVLYLTAEHPDVIDGVVSFSPGEYFIGEGKSETWVQESAAKIVRPVFITSAKNEGEQWKPILAAVPGDAKTGFLPEAPGQHGVSALREANPSRAAYWEALEAFLDTHFPRSDEPGVEDA